MRKGAEQDLFDCRYIIQHLAVETWKRLPLPYRASIDLEDLMQDAKIFVWTEVLPRYSKATRLSLKSFVYKHLRQHFINQTLYYRTQKRTVKDVKPPITQPDRLVESYQVYSLLYKMSSAELRCFLAHAVGVPKDSAFVPVPVRRFRFAGRRWIRVKAEFQELTNYLTETYSQFTLADAETLQKLGHGLLYQQFAHEC